MTCIELGCASSVLIVALVAAVRWGQWRGPLEGIVAFAAVLVVFRAIAYFIDRAPDRGLLECSKTGCKRPTLLFKEKRGMVSIFICRGCGSEYELEGDTFYIVQNGNRMTCAERTADGKWNYIADQ